MDRYERDGEADYYCLNIYYLADVVGGQENPGDEAVELAWFAADELPAKIAFDHARVVLADWVRSTSQG
jgi:8-oxo-dGTP pyrophosphatase MutT (NUDIX family)